MRNNEIKTKDFLDAANNCWEELFHFSNSLSWDYVSDKIFQLYNKEKQCFSQYWFCSVSYFPGNVTEHPSVPLLQQNTGVYFGCCLSSFSVGNKIKNSWNESDSICTLVCLYTVSIYIQIYPYLSLSIFLLIYVSTVCVRVMSMCTQM